MQEGVSDTQTHNGVLHTPSVGRHHHRQCRVCHKSTGALIVPCACRGTISHAHAACMREWVLRTRSASCGVCQQPFAISCVFDSAAPPRPRAPASNENEKGTVTPAAAAPLAISDALRIIARNVGSKLSHRMARGCFFVGVWLIALPLFLSLVWQSLFYFHVVLSAAQGLWARTGLHPHRLSDLVAWQPSLLHDVAHAGIHQSAPRLDAKEWLQAWYFPGLQLIVVGWVAVMALATWWEWCQDTIATFEDPTNFETLPRPLDGAAQRRGAAHGARDQHQVATSSSSSGSDEDAQEADPHQEHPGGPEATPEAAASHADGDGGDEQRAINTSDARDEGQADRNRLPHGVTEPRFVRQRVAAGTSPTHRPRHTTPTPTPTQPVPTAKLIRANDLGRVIDTLGERTGGRLLGAAGDGAGGGALDGQGSVLDHFGLSGSLMGATAIAIAFGVVFVPTALFVLLKLPFVIGSWAGWSLVSAVDWLASVTVLPEVQAAGPEALLPWYGALWAVVAHAMTGLPVNQLAPSALGGGADGIDGTLRRQHQEVAAHRQHFVAASGSYNALLFVSWATGSLILCGVAVQLSRWLRAEVRKPLQIGSAFVRGLIINATHIAFLPAVHGLLLCLLTVGYWVPQRPTAFWPAAHDDDLAGSHETTTVVAAMSLLPRLPIVGGLPPRAADRYPRGHKLRGDGGAEGSSDEDTRTQQVLQPLSPLTLMKAMSMVDAYLVARRDTAPPSVSGGSGENSSGGRLVDVERLFMVMSMSSSSQDGAPLIECNAEYLPLQGSCSLMAPLFHTLTRKPASAAEAVWRFRLYCIGTLMTRVHLFSDGFTWLPLFVSGMMFASVFWHCCYHIRRLVNPRLLKWLFRDPADTPMVQQVIRCRSAMIPVYMLRNIVLVSLPSLLVVRPAFWLLSCLFHQNVPVLLSWSSGNAVVDVLCANLVVFGGRVARVMALVRGNGNFEDEVLFRRFAMVADFLREAHENFFERVGTDLRVLAFLRTATAPSSSQDFFFPVRVMLFALTYIAMATLLVLAILLPGVAVNHVILSTLPHDESVLLHSGHSDTRHSAGGAWLGSASFETHELLAAISVLAADVPTAGGIGGDGEAAAKAASSSPASSLYASFMAMADGKPMTTDEDDASSSSLSFRPLTMHAVIIGWSLLLCISQVYVLLAPHVAHGVATLRHRYLRPALVKATWLQARIESATVGIVSLRHHTVHIGPRQDRPMAESITGYAVRYDVAGPVEWLCSKRAMRHRCERALELLGGPPPQRAIGTVGDTEEGAAASQPPTEDARKVYESVHQVLTDVVLCLTSPPRRPPPRTLSTAGAYLLSALLTDTSLFPWWQQWLSMTVYVGLLSTALLFGPLLLGSGTLRLCCSGSIRTSTQYMTLFASTAAPDDDVHALGTVVDGSWQYWCTSWAFGVVVIALLSVFWSRHFPATSRVLTDFYRVGLLQCASSATVAWRVATGVVGSVLWLTAGFSFLPITVARWSRFLFVQAANVVVGGSAYRMGELFGADVHAAPSFPMSASLESLMIGYREPSDAETLLLHFGVLEWLCVIGWIVWVAAVADRLPFLPQGRLWMLEDVVATADGPSPPHSPSVQEAQTTAAAPAPHDGVGFMHAPMEPRPPLGEDDQTLNDDQPVDMMEEDPEHDVDDDGDVLPALMAAVDARRNAPRQAWPTWSLRRWLEGQAKSYTQASYDAMYLVDIEVHDRTAVRDSVTDEGSL